MSCHPNPVKEVGFLKINLPSTAYVKLDVHSIDGKPVEQLLNKKLLKGEHSISFDVSSLPPGGYFVKMAAEGQIFNTKFIITP